MKDRLNCTLHSSSSSSSSGENLSKNCVYLLSWTIVQTLIIERFLELLFDRAKMS
jgi:hypothetical protein